MSKNKPNVHRRLCVLVTLALLLFGCSLAAQRKGPVKRVAVMHFGPIGDYGWTYEAHLAVQKLAEEFPHLEISEAEKSYGPGALKIMREYASAGNSIIFCHSSNFGELIEQVAPDFPDTVFMLASGSKKSAANIGLYYVRMYEAQFLMGIVAGAMTRSNKIGYTAALPDTLVVMDIDAFARGVASVNPAARVYVAWVGSWYNPAKEKEVTLSLINKKCDVITHHSDSYAPGEAAEERGVYFISHGSDMRRFAPNVFLTGAIYNWAPVMTDIVNAVLSGTWHKRPGQDWWYGLAERGVELAPYSDLVPERVRKMVAAKKEAIIEGTLKVFPGMSDTALRKIYYLEPNVVGSLP